MRHDLTPATLKDVARLAGVSLATVDRVLHGRAGVREATVRKVREVVERLDFRPHAAAAELARAGRLRFCFVMPKGTNTFMRQIAEHVADAQNWMAARRTTADVIETDVFDAATLAEALDALGDQYDGVAVVALDHPLVRAAIDDLVERGTVVVTLVSDVPTSRRAHYVGIDNVAAGRTAASLLGRFLGGQEGKVAIIAGSLALRDHAERLSGFSQVLTTDHPKLRILPVLEGRDDTDRNQELTEQILAEHPDLLGLYNIGAGNEGIAAAVSGRDLAREPLVIIGHDLTPHTRRYLTRGVMDALVHQDAGHQARSAARVLFALATGEPIHAAQEKIRIEIVMRDNLP